MKTAIGNDITIASQIIKQGGLVGMPTETVYGLAANALNSHAVLSIFEAKQRPRFNPLIVHLPIIESIAGYADLDNISLALARAFMPGPLTLLLPKKPSIPDVVTAGSAQVGIRIPNHPIALQLLHQCQLPLAAPSANPFGFVSPTTAQHVLEGLYGKIPYILDGGPCRVGVESTIVEVNNGQITLHRLGGIGIDEIERITNIKVTIPKLKEGIIHAPGQLKSHYATHTPLEMGDVKTLLEKHQGKKVAILSFSTQYPYIPTQDQYLLSEAGNLYTAAQNLFSTLRTIDTNGYAAIIAEYFPNEGIGMAINDRLYRAQSIWKDI